MKQILFSLLFTISSIGLVAQLDENFSDGDFINNPTWEGDIDSFIINTDGQLQLDASVGGTSSLFTEVEIPDSTVWEMSVRMAFSPSGSNQLRIYLQASTIDIANANGYFLEIGESGNDDAIHLYRLDNGAETLLTSGTLGAVADSPDFKIKVTHNANGEWNIFTNYDGGLVLNLEATITDATYQGGDFLFGYFCTYTSTRIDKFYFDNIKITPLLPDVTPPSAVEVVALSFTELEVIFDEVIDEITANDISNYLISENIGNPLIAELDLVEPNKVYLTLNNALTNNTSYFLEIKNIKDGAGNVMNNQNLPFNILVPEPIEVGDLIINEILFNPLTGGKDYVEIYNASQKVLDIGNLFIGNIIPGDEKISDVEESYLMKPEEYVVFTENRDDILMNYTVENETSLINNDLPTFNDAEGNVSIFLEDGNTRIMLDSFDYDEGFHSALLDDEEGVSLERISIEIPSQISSNWQSASSSVGFGTPTSVNSQINTTVIIPEPIEVGDLFINEILFNPQTGGNDYVEIFNASQKVLDLGEIFIGNITPSDQNIQDIERHYLISPGEFVVYTADRDDIIMRYTVENEMSLLKNNLPTFNDTEGNVSIFLENGNTRIMLDSFDYSDDLHFALLDDKNGVSLERISISSPTQTTSNWHSAASTAGSGTPTYQNSQFRTTSTNSEVFSIPETVFSPDQDGFQDVLVIEYQVENQGFLANVKIFDAKGRLVRQLFSNELLAPAGTLTWDGLTEDGLKARIGIYVVLAEIFSPNQTAEYFKKTCVLAGKLD